MPLASRTIDSLGQQLARALERDCTSRCQPDAGGVAHQQLHAESRFQLANLAAQRRLGNEQALGRAAKIEFLGHRHEITQLAQIELLAHMKKVSRKTVIPRLRRRPYDASTW
jgi:hypothetical protein